MRTDDAVKNLQYIGEYEHGFSILNELPHFGLVSNVPTDSMHAVHLGIVRQLIRHWLGDKGGNNKYYIVNLTTLHLFLNKNFSQILSLLVFNFCIF